MFNQEESPPMAPLTELLTEAGSRWVEKDWTATNTVAASMTSSSASMIVGSACQDFDHSDWVNLCELLLDRWKKQSQYLLR